MFSRLSRDNKSVSENSEDVGAVRKQSPLGSSNRPFTRPAPLGRGPLLHLATAYCQPADCLLSVPFQLGPVERPSFVLKRASPHDAGRNITLFIRAI